MKLRRLNETGIERFASYLDRLRTDAAAEPPRELLDDPTASTPIVDAPEVEPREFANRLEAAEYLDHLLSDLDHAEIERDVGLWTWLTLFYFDQVCPPDKRGNRKILNRTMYVPAVNNFQKYYRHLLLGPYMIFTAHRRHIDDALCLLVGPVSVFTDIIEQLASRKERVTNRAVLGAATRLYVDAANRRMKRGAGGRGPGSPRELPRVLEQFDLTFDLYGMTVDDILKLLPRQFDRFKS